MKIYDFNEKNNLNLEHLDNASATLLRVYPEYLSCIQKYFDYIPSKHSQI